MYNFRFWNRITGSTLGKLCRQRVLLAGVALLCFLLPLCLGPAAQAALSGGVAFSGLELAITGPEGDPVPRQLEQLLPSMSDVSEYCKVTAMDYADALRSLRRGEVSAVLVLPENFVGGILNGANPDVELIVNGDAPLEALLTLWVGQSASDMLAAFQSGIYAVLELYTEYPPANLSYGDVMAKINLRYIGWTLNRQDLFRLEQIPVTGQLDIVTHYALSLLIFLMLALAPFFAPVYARGWIGAQRRYRAAGWGSGIFWISTLTACFLVEFVLLLAAQRVSVGGNFMLSVAVCIPAALLCTLFGGVCCLVTADTGSCGILSFSLSLALLGLSGGIVPPVLMPDYLRKLMGWSPVTWLRELLVLSREEFELRPGTLAAIAVSVVVLGFLGGILYGRRMTGGEGDL